MNSTKQYEIMLIQCPTACAAIATALVALGLDLPLYIRKLCRGVALAVTTHRLAMSLVFKSNKSQTTDAHTREVIGRDRKVYHK
jgi:hypothetical protein